MNIHKIYDKVFKIWRVKRMVQFEQIIQPKPDDVVLDIGGYPWTWLSRPQLTKRVDCVNIDTIDWDNAVAPRHCITVAVGDGCSLDHEDGAYDIVFSNSVIEHVGDWKSQCNFAKEARRIGRNLWIQTPALGCPLEPHYLAPFVHWLPVYIRRRVLRWGTPWGWLSKPSQEKIDEVIAFTQLLTKKQMKVLFPDCSIMTERLLWVFPKSYIAFRCEDQ